MNRFLRAVTFALATAYFGNSVSAQTKVRAVVAADRTNVRAQPSADAEILASLAKGQVVEVVGEVIPPKSKEAWSRIVMPPAVTVWVYGTLVDTAKSEVKAKDLNYRAGPGRNYSILGELKKGDPIKIIRHFDGWVQIEPPATAVAYIASRLLEADLDDTVVKAPSTSSTPEPAGPAITTPPPVERATTPVPPPIPQRTATSQPAVETNDAPSVAPTNAPTVVADSTPVVPTTAGTDATPTRAEPVSAEPTSTPAAPARVTSKPDSTTIAPLPPLPVGSPRALAAQPRTTPRPSIPEPAPIPRYVVREGFVERTVSPQAPTDYELRGGFYREGLINYLLLEPQKDLRKFSGKRVMASGFEYSDSRWPTPVLKIQDIQLMP